MGGTPAPRVKCVLGVNEHFLFTKGVKIKTRRRRIVFGESARSARRLATMGKGDKGRSFTPPAQDMRKNVGRFNAKVGRKELKETEAQAIAKKQEPLDVRPILLYIAIFGAACALLFVYLQWVLLEDEEPTDEELIAAAASASKGG